MFRVVLLVFVLAFLPCRELGAQDFFDKVDEFLKINVRDGKVGYSSLNNTITMDDILYDIAHYSMKGRSEEYKAAFYINAYNMLVIHMIQKNWPLKQVLEIEGIFDKNSFKVAGEELSLNEIENKKLREAFGDERIHFALVCGAESCPDIQSFAFEPGALHDQLKYLTRRALEDPKVVRIDRESKTVFASKIFEWYMVDFGNSDEGVLSFITDYSEHEIPEDFKVQYMEYDWSVNGY